MTQLDSVVRAKDYGRGVSIIDPAAAYGLFAGRFSEPLA